MSSDDLRTNPYVGLRPFFADDSLYFFGREPQTAELLGILRQHRFLGVVGSSGSGKSSLVRAGLIPSLLAGFLVHDRDCWRMIQIKPGDTPINNLANGLLEAMGENATQSARDTLERLIRDGHTDAVVEFLTPRVERNANVFLLVDQFEEIFAFRGSGAEESSENIDPERLKARALRQAEADDFVDLMIALAERRELPIYVALTMRTDFLGDCDLFYGLPEALNRGRYLVPRMTREQLRDAVECPALLLGASVAPRLIDHVLNELGDRFDRLPVLQHALLRTWDEWRQTGALGSMDLPHFVLAGGLEGALNKDAEEGALKGLDVDVTARVFKRLTDTDLSQRRIRSPARVSELRAAAGVGSGMVEGILRRFRDDGRNFVHFADDGTPDDPRVDISHESLIRQWTRLRNWVDEERQSRDQYKELVARARKEPRTLLRDPELQMFVDWRQKVSPSRGWAARYTVTEGEFDKAMSYLDESVELRITGKSEVELSRSWARLTQWVATPAGVLLVIWALWIFLAKQAEERAGSTDLLTSLIVMGQIAIDAFQQNRVILVTPLIAYLLLIGGRRLHRKYRLPVIQQALTASGGRTRQELQAHGAERKEAVVVHRTTYASTLRRVGADALDWLAYLPMVVVVVGLLFVATGADPSVATIILWSTGVGFVVGWLYDVFQIVSRNQATVGMRALGIFRTDLRGERLTFARASAWYAARILSIAPGGLGFARQLFTANRQTLHDWIAGTVVLRRPQEVVASAATSARIWGRPAVWVAAGAVNLVVIAIAGFLFVSPPGAAVAVTGVSLMSPPASIVQGGEVSVVARLTLDSKEVVSGKRVADLLNQSGDHVRLDTDNASIVDIRVSQTRGTFDVGGVKLGTARVWPVLLLKNGEQVASADTISVAVIEPPDDRTSAALKAFAVLRDQERISDTLSDAALLAAITAMESKHGAILRNPVSGVGDALDELTAQISDLVAIHRKADSVRSDQRVAILDKQAALATYVKSRMAVRDGHGPHIPDYDTELMELEVAVNRLVGAVGAAGVCRAPCNSEEQRDTLFAKGASVVIRMRYKFTGSGALTVEWRREGQTIAAKRYVAESTPTGYRLWDLKNVGEAGNWEVRVLNAKAQPVFRHPFVVR